MYWFRTPPNTRVGRAALDEDAIRAIEEGNPDIVFDWSKILEAQPQPEPAETSERRRRPRDSRQERGRPPRPPQSGLYPPGSAPDVSVIEEPPPVQAFTPEAPSLEAPAASESISPDGPSAEGTDIADIEPPALVPVTVYHGGADVLVAEASDAPRLSPVEAHLGSEQLGRVRARYSEILARITERVGSDAARLEEMRRAADTLNPDTWVTEAEIVAGLQQFDARLGEIRRALGIKRRRRSRRGGRRRHRSRGAPAPLVAAGAVAPQDASADAFEESDELTEEAMDGPSEDKDDPTD